MLPIVGQILYYSASILALFSVSLFLYKKNKETGFFLIVIYLLYSFFSDTVFNRFLEYYYGSASLGPRIFTIIEFIILNYFVYIKIKSKNLRLFMMPMGMIFILVCIYDYVTSTTNQLDSLSIGTSSVIVLFYLIFYLIEQLEETNTTFIYSKPDFWIISGLVMYTSGTFFTLITSQSKFTEEAFRGTYMLILSSFSLLRNILFLVGFYILPKKEIKIISSK